MKTHQLLPTSKYQGMDDYVSWVELPGFRFHPTEEELLDFYLRNMVFDKMSHSNVIGFLNIYRYDPSDLPGLAKIGEREWYFFVPRDRKQNNGGRPNRTTEHGFWKATGSDRKVVSLSDPKRILGLRKTLVFYKGRAPRGTKSDWVMNEYRLPDNHSFPKDIVLCKVYRKATSLKVLEQWANQEESTAKSTPQLQWSPHSFSTTNGGPQKGPTQPINAFHVAPSHPKEEEIEMDMDTLEFILEESGDNKRNTNIRSKADSTLALPLGQKAPPRLQLPKATEWAQAQAHEHAQDPLWAQLCSSPWLENILSQFTPSSCAADYTSLNC